LGTCWLLWGVTVQPWKLFWKGNFLLLHQSNYLCSSRLFSISVLEVSLRHCGMMCCSLQYTKVLLNLAEVWSAPNAQNFSHSLNHCSLLTWHPEQKLNLPQKQIHFLFQHGIKHISVGLLFLADMTSAIIPDFWLTTIGKHPDFIQEHYFMWNFWIHVFKIDPEKHYKTDSNMGLFKKL